MLVSSAVASLFAAAAMCLMVIACDILGGRSIKLLGAGSTILFVALGGYLTLVDSTLGQFGGEARGRYRHPRDLAVVAGDPPAVHAAICPRNGRCGDRRLPGFVKANYVITWAWTAAYLLMATANLLMIYVPGLPLWAGLAPCVSPPARRRGLFHHMVSATPARQAGRVHRLRQARCAAER